MIHVPATYQQVLTTTAYPHLELFKGIYFFESVYLHTHILKIFPVGRNQVRDGREKD